MVVDFIFCGNKFYEEDQINTKLAIVHLCCIRKICELFKKLNADNIHIQFYIYCYLLWNGYFSVNKTYSYNNRDILDENNTIFLGRGCCRHNSKLLSEILTNMGICAREFGVKTANISLIDMINLEQNIEVNEEKEYPDDCYNHSVTLVNGNNLFLLDPTLIVECEIVKNFQINCCNGRYNIDSKMFVKALNNLLGSNYLYNECVSLSKDVLIENYKIAENMCNESKKMFDDFFDDNFSNYEEIKKLVLSKIDLFRTDIK